jgi:hypothetical protein
MLTRRVDNVDGAIGTAIAKRRAPHLACFRDAAVGVLRLKRVASQDAVRGGALPGADLADKNKIDVGRAGEVQQAAVVLSATHRQTTKPQDY